MGENYIVILSAGIEEEQMEIKMLVVKKYNIKESKT